MFKMFKKKGFKMIVSFTLAVAMISSYMVFKVPNEVNAAAAETTETYTWGPLGGTDDLGRKLPQSDTVGSHKANKNVALFYFLWQGPTPDASGCSINPTSWVIQDVVAAHPEVLNDVNSPYWYSAINSGLYYYWGQPIYGYYAGNDYWVHLKNVQLLTDAGVDLLVLDATNAITYSAQANLLMNAIDYVRAQGQNPPKVVFYTNTQSGNTMQRVYDDFYKAGCTYPHPDDVFYLDGKPLIIGISSEAVGRNYYTFFTYRESQWPNEGQKVNGWPWIEFQKPQKIYYNSSGQKEIVNVSVAQHPNVSMGETGLYGNPGAWGRSYHNGISSTNSNDTAYGYNIQEQWDFAIAQDTPFVFVTGWNEWIAARWSTGNGHSNFVDLATPEYSRDIEPTLTGNLKDNYYMQLVDNIRRYKGTDVLPLPSASKTISTFSDWSDVSPAYKDYTGDTLSRNIAGAPSGITYTNTTGRNDFDVLKVARNSSNLYFYARTVGNITANSGSNWMRLYLDLDRNAGTGWKGYEYRVIGGNTLQQFSGGSWTNVNTVAYSVSLNEMMITIPRSYIGNPGTLNFEFKWSDNMQNDNDPLDWYVNGDVAPGGRFNYIYSETSLPTPPPVQAPSSFDNSGFELTYTSGFAYGSIVSGWTFGSLTGIQHNGSAFAASNAPEGYQTAFVQNNGTMSQTINFTNSGNYAISFQAARRSSGGQQTFNVLLDSTVVGTYSPTSSTFANITTSAFYATAGNHTISFTGTTTGDNTVFIDDVKLNSTANLFDGSGGTVPIQISGTNTAAEKFTATGAFSSIDVCCPSWNNNVGNLTLKLYAWNTNYNTTVAGTPIATKVFTNFNDNAYLKMDFTTQSPGNYLWILSNPVETVGVWKYGSSTSPAGAYWNGAVTTGDYISRIYYAPSITKAWEFTRTTEYWSPSSNIYGFAWQAGGYSGGSITGTDPNIASTDNLGVNITCYKKIEIRLKNSTASTTGQIYFITNADTGFNEAKRKDFTITANDANYTTYTIDMTSVSGWTGTLKQLRVDPNKDVTSGTFSIDYIKIKQ